MDLQSAVPLELDLTARRFGRPQQSGPLTVVPLFGADANGKFTPPLSGLKLGGVRGYGNMELHNPGPSGVAIVPLHMGYIQDRAQNHALCRSAFLGAGQKRLFEDACCVQQAQGGYLESKEQWFFILPLGLRARSAGAARPEELRQAVAGHQRAEHAARSGVARPSGTGPVRQAAVPDAVPEPAGIAARTDRAPCSSSATAWPASRWRRVRRTSEEVWMPLVCFCYGTAALEVAGETAPNAAELPPFAATSLADLRSQLLASRQQRLERVRDWLAQTPADRFDRQEEEAYLGLRLYTAVGEHFIGQFVEDEGRLVYASLAARPEYLGKTLA